MSLRVKAQKSRLIPTLMTLMSVFAFVISPMYGLVEGAVASAAGSVGSHSYDFSNLESSDTTWGTDWSFSGTEAYKSDSSCVTDKNCVKFNDANDTAALTVPLQPGETASSLSFNLNQLNGTINSYLKVSQYNGANFISDKTYTASATDEALNASTNKLVFTMDKPTTGHNIAFDDVVFKYNTAPTSTGPVHNTSTDTYYPTIQEAVNAANSGNEITVSSGTYNENLNIKESLTISGVSGTVINGQIVLNTSTSDSVVLSDFALNNVTNPAIKVPSSKSLNSLTLNGLNVNSFKAIYAADSSAASQSSIGALTIKNSVITSNYPVYIDHAVSNINITGSTFGIVGGNRGVVFSRQSPSVSTIITGNTFNAGDANGLVFVKFDNPAIQSVIDGIYASSNTYKLNSSNVNVRVLNNESIVIDVDTTKPTADTALSGGKVVDSTRYVRPGDKLTFNITNAQDANSGVKNAKWTVFKLDKNSSNVTTKQHAICNGWTNAAINNGSVTRSFKIQDLCQKDANGKVQDGHYGLALRVYDNAGNYLRINNIEFIVDGTKPVVSDFKIDNGSSPFTKKIVASAVVSDDNLNTSNVEFYITKAEDAHSNGAPKCTGNGPAVVSAFGSLVNGRYVASLNTTNLNGNDYCVNVVAGDFAMNHSISVGRLLVTIDNDGPTISNVVYQGTNGAVKIGDVWHIKSINDLKFTADVTDNTGLDHSAFKVFPLNSQGKRYSQGNGTLFCGNWHANGSFVQKFNGTKTGTVQGTANLCGSIKNSSQGWIDGLYEIENVVYDLAGNKTSFQTPTQKFIIDSTAPMLTSVSLNKVAPIDGKNYTSAKLNNGILRVTFETNEPLKLVGSQVGLRVSELPGLPSTGWYKAHKSANWSSTNLEYYADVSLTDYSYAGPNNTTVSGTLAGKTFKDVQLRIRMVDTLGNTDSTYYAQNPDGSAVQTDIDTPYDQRNFKFTVDNTAPVLNKISLNSGDKFGDKNHNLRVYLNITDAGIGLDTATGTYLQFTDGVSRTNNAKAQSNQYKLQALSGNADYNYYVDVDTHDFVPYGDKGRYTVGVRMNDMLGNHTFTKLYTDAQRHGVKVLIDNQGPFAPFITSVVPAFVNNTPTITWEPRGDANNDKSDVSEYLVMYVKGLNTPANGCSDAIVAKCYTVTDLNNLTNKAPASELGGDGEYTVWVRAYDALENGSSWSNSVSFTLDTVAPTITLAPIAEVTEGQPVEVAGSVDGAEADAEVEIFVDGVSQGKTTLDSDGNFSHSVSGLSVGKHSVTAKAQDQAKNEGESEHQQAIVNPAAPQITSGTANGASGTATTGARVVVKNSAGDVLGEAEAYDNGKWNLAFSPALTVTTTLVATATMGELTSAESESFEVVVAGPQAAPAPDQGGGDSDISGGDSVAILPGETDDDTLGDNVESDDDKGSVQAETDGKKAGVDGKETKGCFKLLGLCWYYWIPVVIIIAVVAWWLTSRRREQDTTA